MVSDNRPLLDTLAHTLLENEVLEREDIERLVAVYKGQAAPLNGAPVDPGPIDVAAAEGDPSA
jgi:hypothetical protein